jgi:polar amino acid transport system permease protein
MKKNIRFTWLDGVLMALLAGAALLGVHRISADLHYIWQWSAIPQYILRFEDGAWRQGAILRGFIVTVKISLWTTFFATLLGTFMALLHTARGRVEHIVSTAYVELVRNLPPLVLIFIVYFFFGDRVMIMLDIEERIRTSSPTAQTVLTFLFAPPARLPGFVAGLATLVVYEGAYITEIVRAGIQSIEKGQWEAAHALGLTRLQQLRFVIMPQTFQRILPSLGGQLISTVKDSAIVSVISIPELTFQGMEIMSSTYMTFEIWITVMAMYFALTFSCSLGIRHLEGRWQRRS